MHVLPEDLDEHQLGEPSQHRGVAGPRGVASLMVNFSVVRRGSSKDCSLSRY
jgi:hypothetical protein